MLPMFLSVLLIAVLLATASIYSDLKARDRTPSVPPPSEPQEGVWPPPPTNGER